MGSKKEHLIQKLDPEKHRDFVVTLMNEHWGGPQIVTRGKLWDVPDLPGFVSYCGDQPSGLITYIFHEKDCEIITLNSLKPGLGIGSALIDKVMEHASNCGYSRLFLITTNDNLSAVRFYQKRGFHLVAVHRNAVKESRKLKPCIPETGIDDIPIRDEIELELAMASQVQMFPDFPAQ